MQKLMPWIEPSDMPAVRSWAELELIGACIFDEIMKRGLFTQARKGKPGGAVSQLIGELRNTRNAQLRFGVQLGMTPLARQMLRASGDAPDDLVAAFARDEARERKRLEQAKPATADENETSDAAVEKSSDE